MTTKSQEAFEESHWEHNLRKLFDGRYVDNEMTKRFITWQAAEALGRKQALEELQAVYHCTYPSIEAQLAAIKELIK